MSRAVISIDLEHDTGKRVRIIKCSKRILEGKTGSLTAPFGNHCLGYVGIFLDEPLGECDIINVIPTDEVEFLNRRN